MSDAITTPEALDALPIGSVVLDGMGDAWQRSDAASDWWAPANPFYAEADAANVLEQGGTEHPATLLHRPDRPSDLTRAKAEAWDEGEKAGAANQSAWDGWRYKRGYPITNPYRADRIDPTEGNEHG